jgi:hypothetical protein
VQETPGFSDVIQALPSAPQDFDARLAIMLAAQETTQLGDPTYRLM